MTSQNEYTLDPEMYTDKAVFFAESAKLFSDHWWLIGSEASISQRGSYLCAKVGGANLFVVRNEKAELNAFHNICRHRAGPIVTEQEGICPGKLLVCQYHGWSYDLSGNLVNAHELTRSVDRQTLGLKPVRVAIWNQMVFVCLSDSAPSLMEWLGPLTAKVADFMGEQTCEFHDKIEKTAATNWKCYGDNACEGYHVGLVHKTLGQTASDEKITLTCEQDGQYVRFDVAYENSVADLSRTGKGLWIYKFPGLLIHCSAFGFNAESVMPVSESVVDITRWFWTDHAAVAKANMQSTDLITSASTVMDEDINICEQVYSNMASGFAESGPLSPGREPGTIFFQKQVKDLSNPR